MSANRTTMIIEPVETLLFGNSWHNQPITTYINLSTAFIERFERIEFIVFTDVATTAITTTARLLTVGEVSIASASACFTNANSVWVFLEPITANSVKAAKLVISFEGEGRAIFTDLSQGGSSKGSCEDKTRWE